VCLLVVAFRHFPGTPLLIGANRDEFLARPAIPMTVLRAEGPRVLGGRDEQSGGTWFAVNEWGVFAGLTNQPREGGRDTSRRTRGELPLALAAERTAGLGVEHFLANHRPSDYNGSWLLVGDRDSLFFIDFTGLVEPAAVALSPGVHVLENRPLGAPSPKTDRVTATLAASTHGEATNGESANGEAALAALRHVLKDHTSVETPAPNGPKSSANCVHLDEYGTRSSCLVRCEEDEASPPRLWVADGPPCTAPFVDVSALWAGPAEPPL
jgi:uncharacterized protein with NRDE domain